MREQDWRANHYEAIRERNAAEALLHQIRSIAHEYRNGEHWSSVGMERIAALLEEFL